LSEIVLYINGLFQLNETDSKMIPTGIKEKTLNHTTLEKLNLLLAQALKVSVIVLPPVFVYGLHFINPCKVSLVGSILIPQCRDGGEDLSSSNGLLKALVNVFVKFSLLLVNHYMLAIGLFVAILMVCWIWILGIVLLRQQLSLYDLYNVFLIFYVMKCLQLVV